jgi:hypothetical protein
MNITDWLVLGLLVSYPFAILGLRSWVTAAVTRKVQHGYDQKLEQLRTELRLSEERTKAELRAKEQEVAALRDGAIGARAGRRALLDRRRLEGVDRLWGSVHELGAFKAISMFMSVLNFDEAAKRAAKDENFRNVIKTMGGDALQLKTIPRGADTERPFVSPLSWALYSAYRAVLGTAFARMKILEIGVDEPQKLLNENVLRDMLIAVLPEREDGIKAMPIGRAHDLLDEIEAKLLDELKRMLAGEEDDEETIKRAAKISQLAAEASSSNEASRGEITAVLT